MKLEPIAQSKAKVTYQHDHAADVIHITHAYLCGYNVQSDKIQRDDLIDNKIRSMNESNARCNLFTIFKFDIKGFINPYSIKHSALTQVDITTNYVVYPLTTKGEIEDHLLQHNPLAYWASVSTPFGHTPLGRLLGDTCDSPLAESIPDESFTRHNLVVRALTSHLQRRPIFPDIPSTNISERTFSRAFGGLREKSSVSPSGLYNAHYMCLVSKKTDSTPNPICMIHAQLMEIPTTHGFTPERHQVRYDCPIFKKPGNFKSESLRLVHGIEATENQTLKIGVAWQIKRLVREHEDIFYEFQFGRPNQTCPSTIILKQLTIDSFVLTKNHGIIIDKDATGAFDRVINGIALIALRSLAFYLMVTRMIGLAWRNRKCYIKAVFGIYTSYYQ
jgi:hypothetical protein